MGIFDLFKSKKEKVTVDGIGDFSVEEGDYGKALEGSVDSSSLGEKVEITFPLFDPESESSENMTKASDHQIKHFHWLTENASEIKRQIQYKKNLPSQDFAFISILIPHSEDDRFDMSSELVCESSEGIFSAVVVDQKVDAIIDIE